MRYINTTSDSEVLLNVFAREMQRQGKQHLDQMDVFDAVQRLHRSCKGGYAVVAMIVGYGLVAFRDPNGIRPLVFVPETESGKKEYMVLQKALRRMCRAFLWSAMKRR